MQQISFYIMRKTIWASPLISHVYYCIMTSILLSALIGIATYYLVEKPGYTLKKIVSFNN